MGQAVLGGAGGQGGTATPLSCSAPLRFLWPPCVPALLQGGQRQARGSRAHPVRQYACRGRRRLLVRQAQLDWWVGTAVQPGCFTSVALAISGSPVKAPARQLPVPAAT